MRVLLFVCDLAEAFSASLCISIPGVFFCLITTLNTVNASGIRIAASFDVLAVTLPH